MGFRDLRAPPEAGDSMSIQEDCVHLLKRPPAYLRVECEASTVSWPKLTADEGETVAVGSTATKECIEHCADSCHVIATLAYALFSWTCLGEDMSIL